MRKTAAFPSVLIILSFVLVTVVIAADSAQKPTDGDRDKVENKNESSMDINWLKYDEGLKLAKKENKKLMVEFTAKWCGYCKKMRATTFKEPDVVSLIGENFITASVDGESRDTINVDGWITSGRRLSRDYQIRGYPTYWFLTPDGEKIAPVRGYRSGKDLAYILEYLKDDLYKTKKFDEFVREKQQGK